jgi:hypothetical protein
MVGGISGIALGLVGVGDWTVVACGVVVALSTVSYGIAAIRQRPRVVITPEGFVFDKLFGRDAHRWEEVEGPFAVIKVGWNEVVAYNLTPEYKGRTGRKPTSLFSGYDAAVGGSTLSLSAGELAEVLNAHKKRSASDAASQAEKPSEPVAESDRGGT